MPSEHDPFICGMGAVIAEVSDQHAAAVKEQARARRAVERATIKVQAAAMVLEMWRSRERHKESE